MKIANSLVLIATQPLEEFRIPVAYWEHFLSLCLEKIAHPENYTFLLKPHPRQSEASVQQICEYLEHKGLSYERMEAPSLRNLSLEILFAGLTHAVEYVFSPYSSSVFYLSVLYPQASIQYFYSLQSVLAHADAAPELYTVSAGERWRYE